MNSAVSDLLASLITCLPAFVRISATMLLMPALSEAAIPATARMGLSAGLAIAISSSMPSENLLANASSLMITSTVMNELLAGIWFGLLTRLVALTLPMAGQYAGYMVGLSNVLQADVDPTVQSDAIGSLFGLISPLLFLVLGLYRLPLRALVGFFDLVPIGHLLPLADSAEALAVGIGKSFFLSLQLASPFVIVSILWNLFIGQMARLGGRMQIYFLSFPGQILLGLLVLIVSIEPILLAWQHYAEPVLLHLPGGD